MNNNEPQPQIHSFRETLQPLVGAYEHLCTMAESIDGLTADQLAYFLDKEPATANKALHSFEQALAHMKIMSSMIESFRDRLLKAGRPIDTDP